MLCCIIAGCVQWGSWCLFMHRWSGALGVRHMLLAASVLWTGWVSSRETGEQLGKEGTGAQGGLGQQLKASRGRSEVQDSLQAVPVPTLCIHMLV